MIKVRYGEVTQTTGLLGVGKIQYSWTLVDDVIIQLNQNSPSHNILLEYIVPEKYAQYKKEKTNIFKSNQMKSFVFDVGAF